MSKVESVIKHLLERLIARRADGLPKSNMPIIREMHSRLPKQPQKGKVAPVWQKDTQTDGTNGADTF